MSLRVAYDILNQKGTPAFYSDTLANRPAFGFAGRVFISTDTGQIFEDTGSAWTLIADAGAGGGSLETVTTNGNTTDKGIVITAGNLGINTATPGAPLDIHGTGTNAQFNGTGTNNAYLQFQNAGTSKWRIGNTYSAGANNFDLYNNSLASTALSFNLGTNAATFNNSVTATSFVKTGGTASQFLKANGSIDSTTYLSGTGTNTYLPKWNGANSLTDSLISDNGSSLSIYGSISLQSDYININSANTFNNGILLLNRKTNSFYSNVQFLNNGSNVWNFGMNGTGVNDLVISDSSFNSLLTIDATTKVSTFSKGLRVTSASGDNQVWIYGTSPGYRLYDTITSPTINAFVGLATAVNNFIQGTASGDMAIGTSTGGKIYIGTASGTITPQMTIVNSGNIGIGTTTPSALLHLSIGNNNKIFYTTGATNGYQYGQMANTTGNFIFGIEGASSGNIQTGNSAYSTNLTTGSSTDLSLGTNQIERMRITSAGLVAVGLTNPTAKLEVNGAFRVSDEATYGATISHVTPSGAGGVAMYADGGQYLHFGINSTDTLNISASNNVVIGSNTDAGGKLQVVGDIRTRGVNAALYFQNQVSTNLFAWYGNTNIFCYNQDVGIIASINYATGVYTPLSDINKKKDFEQSTIGLEAILNLKPTLFRMKDEDETKEKTLGFIAQEVKEFIPQAYVEENEFIGLNDRPIIAALVKAIQELNYKIENLKN